MSGVFDDPRKEAAAKAIYYANWRRLVTGNFPPIWENAQESIRNFVRRQAENALRVAAEADCDESTILPLDPEAAAWLASRLKFSELIVNGK